MSQKKLLMTMLIVVLSTLLVNQASALTITVFAPSTYPYIDLIPGAAAFNGQAYPPNANGFTANQYAPVNPASHGWAETWMITPWMKFTEPTQDGSVHVDTWLEYLINGSSGVWVFLFHVEWDGHGSRTWGKWWSDALPGFRNKTVDLGISKYDLSISNWPGPQNPLPFKWTKDCYYMTYVYIFAYASAGSRSFIEVAKYDDILWIAYVSSPESPWVQSPGDPQIGLNPPMGPVGTKVTVNGAGFAPESQIYVYYDDGLVNQTLSDGYGNFTCSFKVPSGTKGPHTVRAMDALENIGANVFYVFIEAPPIVGDINNDHKVDIKDLVLVIKYFGKTDPNMIGLPGSISMTIPFIATTGLTIISMYALQKRKKHEKRA